VSADSAESRALFSIVLGDANVLYSRVLRDYLLYAMTHHLIRVIWSAEILDEVIEHLTANIESFDKEAGRRLVSAMNSAFPHSQIEITDEARAAVAGYRMTDEDDRHVIAAAVSAEATALCSDDRTGFPPDVMQELGIKVITSDSLLSAIITDHPETMIKVHRAHVTGLKGATDQSTLDALRRAGARNAAELVETRICAYPSSPRALNDGALRAYRLEQAKRDPAVLEINRLVWRISKRENREGKLAYLDPTFGGIDAEVVLLLKAPQADADVRRGSGRLLSLDNDDDVAATLFELLGELGVDRKRFVAWNMCIFPIRNFDPSDEEFVKGKEDFRSFVAHLRRPKTIVVMGSAIRKGWHDHDFTSVAPGLRTVFTPSPSPPGIDRPGARNDLRIALAEAFRA
jgi:predicted nucleic acid-binding protein